MTDSLALTDAKRTKKPKPLFGLFRKTKPDPLTGPVDLLGSGASVPLSSVIQTPYVDPYTSAVKPKPNLVMAPSKSSPLIRQHSRSEGRDTSSREARPCARSLTAREKTLNKLCEREISASSTPVPPKSPTHRPPPLPPMPAQHQLFSSKSVTPPRSPRSPRKPPSASDLSKMPMHLHNANHESTFASKLENARSRSLSAPKHFNQSSRMPTSAMPSDNPKTRPMPTTSRSAQYRPRGTDIATKPRRMRKASHGSRDQYEGDDDDIPLATMLTQSQRQRSKPSSLLNDDEEEDDQDLVPIAELPWAEDASANADKYQSAAEKYKEKVKERLLLEDDDDIPISRFVNDPKSRPCITTGLPHAVDAM